MLSASSGTVVFGSGGFILHRLELGAVQLTDGSAGEREVRLEGYILPGESDSAARRTALERAKRLICRVAADAGGCTLTHGGRVLSLSCTAAPAFSADPPLTGDEAAFFTLRARSEHGAFCAGERTLSGRGRNGALIFPLAITEETVFGTLSQSGVLTVENPGDLAAGFSVSVTAEGGTLTKLTLSLGEAWITVTHEIADGESIVIDTRAGQRSVTKNGTSILTDTDYRSTFFALPPGESALSWTVEGSGHAALRLTFEPLYL